MGTAAVAVALQLCGGMAPQLSGSRFQVRLLPVSSGKISEPA